MVDAPDTTSSGTKHRLVRSALMDDGKVYDEATKVTAKNGEVILDGPDGVDVKLTPKPRERRVMS